MNKYELMKKAFFMEREDKEYFLDNLEEILENIKEKDNNPKKKKYDKKQNTDMDTKRKIGQDHYTPSSYTHVTEYQGSGPFNHDSLANNKGMKKTSKVYDPETKEEMIKILDTLEKHLGIDGDCSYENISVFLKTISHSSRKLVLRPYKLVGICRKIEKLSREFQRNKNDKKRKKEIEKDFLNRLIEMRRRLSGEESLSEPLNFKLNPERKNLKKAGKDIGEDSLYRDNLKNNIVNLKQIGLSREEAYEQALLISPNLSYDIEGMIDSIIDEVY